MKVKRAAIAWVILVVYILTACSIDRWSSIGSGEYVVANKAGTINTIALAEIQKLEIDRIYEDGRLAGFYWIEERGQELHLHGLILKEQFQSRGIGIQTLHKLETEYKERMAFIEVGVHKSNERARTLYKKLDYKTVKVLDDLDFYIVQGRLV